MSKKSFNFYILLIVFSILLPKWIITFIQTNPESFVGIMENINDDHYFPLVISFANFDFNPTYLEKIKDAKLLSFPVLGIIFHSLFYKIFGILTFPVLELIFKFTFLLIFIIFCNKILNNKFHSFIFCILIYLIIISLKFSFYLPGFKYLEIFYITLEDNFGTRFPRPLITSIFFFSFFLLLCDLKKNIEKFSFKYFVTILFLLSSYLNSFFYYFINLSLLFLIMFTVYKNNILNYFFFKERRSLIYLIVLFFIFSSPFILQNIFGETDYMQRIGVISLDMKQRIMLITYYLKSLLNKEFLLLIFFATLLHVLINKNSQKIKINTNNLNILFFFIISSILGPLLFFFFSPKVISIYHFLGILIFSLIFYLIFTLYIILINYFDTKRIKLKSNHILKFLIFIYFFLNVFSENLIIKNKKEEILELNKIQLFLKKNKFQNTKNKLFTNNLKIMNLWLLNGNTELIISDGFTNSLKNNQIEFNLINNLKHFEISKQEFKKMLFYGESKNRIFFFIRLFIYRYQANSLYTFSELENYTEDYQNNIQNISPFRSQSQIIPEDEKDRLLDLFDNIETNSEFFSNIAIVKREGIFKDFKIKNSDYKSTFSTKNYDIYELKN